MPSKIMKIKYTNSRKAYTHTHQDEGAQLYAWNEMNIRPTLFVLASHLQFCSALYFVNCTVSGLHCGYYFDTLTCAQQ